MAITSTMELLSARHYIYSVFQRIMGDVPTAELFGAIDVQVLAEAFQIAGAPAADVEPFLGMLADPELDVDALEREYARIFVGPSSLPAPPWESVYRDHKRVVMTATTLAVRDAYRAQGFIPARYPHVPDDHLALELDFLAALTVQALEACQAGDEERAAQRQQVADEFRQAHLGTWAGEFAQGVHDRANSPFYAAAASALAAFVS